MPDCERRDNTAILVAALQICNSRCDALLINIDSGDAMKEVIKEEGIVTKSSKTVNPSRNSPLCQSEAHIITEVVAILGD